MLVETINNFSGEYAFLSNFCPAPTRVPWDNRLYPTSEHAYQAAKTDLANERDHILKLTSGQAKRFRGHIRDDWEQVKVNVMMVVVEMKFMQNSDLCDKLLGTGTKYLEEGNTWGDTFWGTVDGKGRNVLGNILMSTRQYFYEELTAIHLKHGSPSLETLKNIYPDWEV